MSTKSPILWQQFGAPQDVVAELDEQPELKIALSA
jgi:hypothetical protein